MPHQVKPNCTLEYKNVLVVHLEMQTMTGKNKRGHYQHIVAWDSLGRVTATVNRLESCVYDAMVATSSFLDFFKELNPCCGLV